jgi:hypothetical protein
MFGCRGGRTQSERHHMTARAPLREGCAGIQVGLGCCYHGSAVPQELPFDCRVGGIYEAQASVVSVSWDVRMPMHNPGDAARFRE